MNLRMKEVDVTMVIASLAAVSLVGFIAYVLYIKYLKRRWLSLGGDRIHTLDDWPVLGAALRFANLHTSSDVWQMVTDCSTNYPQGVMLWLFHLPWLLIKDLETVEKVLVSTESVDKSYVYGLLNTITDGVFSVNGLRWKKLRKKTNLSFSPRKIDQLHDEANEQAALCIEILKKNTNKYINIITFIIPYFFDTVCRTHFGVETTEQINRSMQMTERAAKVIELTMEHRFFRPINHLNMVFKSKRVFKYIKHVRRDPLIFTRKIIGQRLEVAAIEKAKGLEDRKRMYFVDDVKETLEELKIKPTPYNIERNTGDMLVAASDTTAVAVSAALYFIALYPDIQEKVFQDVMSVFRHETTKRITKDDISSMEYLDMVLKETLRHAAPPGIARCLPIDLDVGKYIIPKGTNVYIVMKAIHTDPHYYERPTEFYPEHFLPEKVKERPKFAFIPFSHGPRNCPGMAYGYVAMKIIIANIIRNFKLDTNIPLKNIQYKMVLMQEHTNGYFVKLTPRN